MPDGLEPDRRPALLRRRGVHGPDRDVVGAAARARLRLRDRVRGEPDNPARADDRPRGGDRLVVLADVHAVRVRGRGEIRAVVDEEQRARRLAEPLRLLGRREQLVVARRLVPKLEQVDPAGERRGQDVRQRTTAGSAVADEVQTGLFEPFEAIHARQCRNRAALALVTREPVKG